MRGSTSHAYFTSVFQLLFSGSLVDVFLLYGGKTFDLNWEMKDIAYPCKTDLHFTGAWLGSNAAVRNGDV